ncbi:hypothetical protein GQ43DRAFT_79476 [Delitschia confertaspora ATCC 74209]|uniref:Protein Zds1 C-terminal domain-containing protein n=1 Tax=Delitschia confertaspora ATCC 74209 TaxID=1513339 RepID=A0A9P4MRC9_9PLEO|nr:hypothetical protein GQ43DRAFT_79476 [Delitschia confertaspora ATCC 74209]
MQAAERARELDRVYQSRRGHVSQISISDDNHHVTEAIGDLYGDDHYSKRDSRPLSFISSPLGDNLESASAFDPSATALQKSPLRSAMTNDRSPPPGSSNGSLGKGSRPTSSFGRTTSNGQLSPPPLNRTNSDTAQQQFPLNDIDYESSPAAVAQELSNLQAIRRMSMDVNTADPDLPSFRGVPTIAPQHFSEDEDPSKLFWVPARLHPELAPKEFKTFIEEKVDKIRRRSGDSDTLSPDGPLGRQGSAGGLRRKKSMLSRQIDSPNGYRDGAERLERKRSGAKQGLNGSLPHLQELEHLVEDPTSLARRMSIGSSNSGGDIGVGEDVPILPAKPGTLKRSTRTTYRRGSLRKGERVPFSRRVAARQAGTDTEDSPTSSPTHASHAPDAPFGHRLGRVQSEPVPREPVPGNPPRPGRKRTPPVPTRSFSADEPPAAEPSVSPAADQTRTDQARNQHPTKPFHSRIASNGRTTAPLPGYSPQQVPVPQIVETPPPQEPQRMQLPERHSSRGPPPPTAHQNVPPRAPPPNNQRQQPRQQVPRPAMQRTAASPIKPTNQTFDAMIGQPSPLLGNSTRTDTLSIIPNLAEEKKPDKKSKERKDEGGGRKTSWGWLLGGDNKEKERDKEDKEEREKELAKRVKNKLTKGPVPEKAHDNTRLDVLQASIDGGRGRESRESVVLDRDSIKLEEERKKESSRKSSGSDTKKEKESGLFSSIFGGGKKKTEKESGHKKGSSMRGLSPEPPPRILKPDIDYNWTRFSILEERAIYRMAHIKLANPRRELYSQVLLSNFMYSYLAKVQQMHPQIQIGQQGQKKQQQRQAAQQKQQDQPEEFNTYQKYQQQQQQQQQQEQTAHHSQNNPADPHPSEQALEEPHNRPDSRASQHSSNQQYQHQSNGNSYSVASGQNYLGQPGGKPQQSYYGYDDQDVNKDDEMW